MLELNKIYLDNCFNLFPQIEDNSIDLILTDPPYQTTGLKFDKGAINWQGFYTEMYRVLKPNGWFFMFGTLEMWKIASDYFKTKFHYVWKKPGAVLSSKSAVRPRSIHENIFALVKKDVKPSTLTFNEDALKTYGHASYSRSQYKRKGKWMEANNADGYSTPPIIERDWRYGTSVLEFPSVLYMKKDERAGHPTQKSLDLIKYIIGGYSNPNELIFDPFIGSGTTAVGALALGRNYIGIDNDQEYYDMAINRINNFKAEC